MFGMIHLEVLYTLWGQVATSVPVVVVETHRSVMVNFMRNIDVTTSQVLPRPALKEIIRLWTRCILGNNSKQQQ